jgi:ABC-2 type transport system permease protein
MTLPFQSINTAYWDKRLEVYNSSYYGVWAFITGRFIWTFIYQLLIQSGILILAVRFAGVSISVNIPVLPLLVYYFSFIFTCFGFGLIGASTFFSLEVKQGREPFTLLVDVLARIFSGVYYPLAILPVSLTFISRIIPHTYALEGIRLIMLGGQGFENVVVRNNTFVMLGFALTSMLLGILALRGALIKAHSGNGVGIVV